MADNPNSVTVIDNHVDVFEDIYRSETSVDTINGNQLPNHIITKPIG